MAQEKAQTAAADKYFLPAGYRENPVRTTMDSESGGTYWNAQRLSDSYNYQYHVYRYALDLIVQKGIKRVIDIGCGPAMKLSMFHKEAPDLEITGIDQDHPIRFCQERHGFGRWLSDDFENPRQDIPDLEAELAINADVIEHVIDPDKVLAYIRHRLAPGGMALISTPDRDRNYGTGKMESGHRDHIREWNKAEFAQYLRSRGWQVLEHFHVPGIRPSFSHAYMLTMARHILQGSPKNLEYNQVVLAKPPSQ